MLTLHLSVHDELKFVVEFSAPVHFGPLTMPLKQPRPDLVFAPECPWDGFILGEVQSTGQLVVTTLGRGLGEVNVATRGILTLVPLFVDIPARRTTLLEYTGGMTYNEMYLALPWHLQAESGMTPMAKIKLAIDPNRPVASNVFASLLLEGGNEALLNLANHRHLTEMQYEALLQCPWVPVLEALSSNPSLPGYLRNELRPFIDAGQ